MNPLLVAVLAAVGLAAGWVQQPVIARYTMRRPEGHPAYPVECAPDGKDRHRIGRASGPSLGGHPQYPPLGARPMVAGVTTAVVFGALAARVHPGLVLAAACWLALCAVPLAFIDAAVRRLPDPLTGAAFAGTALLLLAAAAAGGQWHSLVRAVLGGVALAGFYVILTLISPAGMGLGDGKAAAGIGTLLAWPGWRLLIAGGVAGFLLAAIYGIALLASGRATRKQQMPFGPFMLAGAFAAILAWHV